MKKKKIIAVLTALTVLTLTLITTCQMEVDEAVQNVALTDPYISKHPASYSFFVNESLPSPLTLSIEVNDWAANDGDLTYQWYTFNDVNKYIKGEATEIDGANGPLTFNDETGKSTATYTPTLNSSTEATYYYYVEVTNDNPRVNVGDQIGTVRSEVAIISFTATGGALPPIISRHPGNAEYQAGRSVNTLNVRAAARIDGTPPKPRNTVPLSYEWFILPVVTDADDNITTIGEPEPIPNVNDASYQPDPSELKFGKNYFFVEVTSTEGTEKATTRSIPALIEILSGARAIAPVITVQPRDKMYFTGDTVGNLTVTGVSRDNGDIKYQWYSNDGDVISATSGTPIEDAVNAAYKPEIETDAAKGPFYYYAVVTNFNEFVTTAQTTASVTSKLAKVTVAAKTTTEPSYNATVTVSNPKVKSNRYQYVRGYGGMDVAWANFPRTYQAEMETMYDPNKLGYNINRIMISPGKVNPSDGIQDLISRHRPDYYENVKIVNKHGGYNLASPWSPPKEWKSNNSINGGGVLLKQYYQQFADYLKAFAQDMYDHGAPIYAISISNEPNYTAGYDGCEWKPDEMRDFYKQVGRFTYGVRGFGGGRQISTVLTVNGESANNPDINLSALRDPISRAAIDLLCRHVYGSQTSTLWRYGPPPVGASLPGTAPWDSSTPNILDREDGTKYEVWMTEHNINSANAQGYVADSTWPYVWRYMNDVDLVMRLNNENAFVWWASKRFYSMIGDGQYGTNQQNDSNTPAVLPRGWGLSHYAKYTIDTHRIKADVSGTLVGGTAITFEGSGTNVKNRDFALDNTSARITAYASITSGKDNAPINDSVDDVEFISLVMWTPTETGGGGGRDMGTVKIEMPVIDGQQFLIGSYTAIKSTSETSTHVAYTVTVAEDRKSAFVTLNGSQILSVKFIKE